MLLSVKEYAEREGKSVQAIYKQIKNGSLKTKETETGLKILVDELNSEEVEKLKSEKEYLKSLAQEATKEKERWYQLFNQTNTELKEVKETIKQIEYKSLENDNLKQEIDSLKYRLKEQEEILIKERAELIYEKGKKWWQKLLKK